MVRLAQNRHNDDEVSELEFDPTAIIETHRWYARYETCVRLGCTVFVASDAKKRARAAAGQSREAFGA